MYRTVVVENVLFRAQNGTKSEKSTKTGQFLENLKVTRGGGEVENLDFTSQSHPIQEKNETYYYH